MARAYESIVAGSKREGPLFRGPSHGTGPVQPRLIWQLTRHPKPVLRRAGGGLKTLLLLFLAGLLLHIRLELGLGFCGPTNRGLFLCWHRYLLL